MSEITDEQIHNLAEDIIEINCAHCKEFSKPIGESCCWCESIGEVITNELYFMGSGPEEERVEDENRVAAAWEKIQKEWFEQSG